jgi:Pyruvate-formate lyase
MYKKQYILERELRITKAYQENIVENKAVRELRVLEQQIPFYFIKPREQDLIAGRIDRPFLVFSPCLEADGKEKVAYGINVAACREEIARIEADSSYSPEYVKSVHDMMKFWETENTNTKIRNRLPKEYLQPLYTEDYSNDPAAIHPIYRVAGINLDFKKLFKYGLTGLQELVTKKSEQTENPNEKLFFLSMCGVLDLIKEVIRQYAEEAEAQIVSCADVNRRSELLKMRNSLLNLLDNPPATFQEALQLQVIYMLASRSVELGRLDDYMADIYEKSLREGTVTHDEAVALLNNLFTIVDEEKGRDTRAIIGGVGRENPKKADAVAMLVLEVLEIRKFQFFPQVSLRCHKGMNEEIYTRSLDLIGQGYTFPLLYNDDVNVPSTMRAMDVSRKVAEQYSFFGCGEYMIAGKSIGTPNTVINIAKALELALFNGKDLLTGKIIGRETGEFRNDTTFDELMKRFKIQLDLLCDIAGTFEELLYDVCNEECSFLLYSLLQDDCIGRGKALIDGGIEHLGGTGETYGNVTAYDGMTAIKEVIYEKKLFTQEHLLDVLRANFEGFEKEHTLLRRATKFGNDDPAADEIATELHEYICNGIRRQRDRTRLDSFLVVVINNNMNVALGRFTGATPDGRHSKDFLSNGNGANSGCDKNGLTALLNSLAKMDTSIHAGGNQNLKLSPAYFENNFEGIRTLVSAFFELGGQQLNLSILNQADMEDAMIHPEKHENLTVRVGGFSARFITLDPTTQRDMIQRTAY